MGCCKSDTSKNSIVIANTLNLDKNHSIKNKNHTFNNKNYLPRKRSRLLVQVGSWSQLDNNPFYESSSDDDESLIYKSDTEETTQTSQTSQVTEYEVTEYEVTEYEESLSQSE
eukprot:328846_1